MLTCLWLIMWLCASVVVAVWFLFVALWCCKFFVVVVVLFLCCCVEIVVLCDLVCFCFVSLILVRGGVWLA